MSADISLPSPLESPGNSSSSQPCSPARCFLKEIGRFFSVPKISFSSSIIILINMIIDLPMTRSLPISSEILVRNNTMTSSGHQSLILLLTEVIYTEHDSSSNCVRSEQMWNTIMHQNWLLLITKMRFLIDIWIIFSFRLLSTGVPSIRIRIRWWPWSTSNTMRFTWSKLSIFQE